MIYPSIKLSDSVMIKSTKLLIILLPPISINAYSVIPKLIYSYIPVLINPFVINATTSKPHQKQKK